MPRESNVVLRLSKEFANIVDTSADFLKAIGPHVLHIGLYAVGFARKMRANKWKPILTGAAKKSP